MPKLPARLTAISLLATAALLVPAGSALAKPPPRGKYDCVIGPNTILFGTITIKRASKYSHRGTNGTFGHGRRQVTFPDGIKGWKINFKKGSLGGFKGRWYKTVDGTPKGNYEIALRNPRDDFESIYCSRRK